MKCKECNTKANTLRRGMCRSCLNARSHPIEAFSDEQLLEELKRRKTEQCQFNNCPYHKKEI